MINVTCAIIIKDYKVLATQRSDVMSLPLKWEFPGGKIEDGESSENCLLREIKEELNLEIKIVYRLEAKPYNYENFSINLIPFVANFISGEILLLEHNDFKWLSIDELKQLDWAEADIPVLEAFINLNYGTTRTL
jgi:8-oxo-dGTP diphosphatase